MKSICQPGNVYGSRQSHVSSGESHTHDKAIPAPDLDENSGTEVHIALDGTTLLKQECGL